MNKILVFDIDGTLLNSKHEINESTLFAIRYAKKLGMKIILCSGRPYFDMKYLQDDYDIADYMVCNNGSYWYDVSQKQFTFNGQISSEIAMQAIKEGQKFCSLLALHTDKATYRSQLCDNQNMPSWFHKALEDEKKMFFDKYNYPLSQTIEHVKNERILQVAFRLNPDGAKQLAKRMRQILKNQVDVFIANDTYVDINMRDVNKFNGLKKLCEVVGCDTQNMVAFGDSNNDLQMLEQVGYGICMGNGTPEAKKIAKEVIGNNDSDAISQKIYELI